MKINSREVYEKIHLLSQESIESVKNVLDAIQTMLILDYTEKTSTSIPGLGVVSILYSGDKLTSGGRQAKIEISVNPDDSLLKSVGQVEDKEESDIEKRYKMKIKSLLTEIVQK